jgi:hypothetical protein
MALAFLLIHPNPGHTSPAARGRARHRHIVPASLRSAGDSLLAARIIGFARARLGTQVGDGQCYDLADAALHAAGARSAPDFGQVTPDADYVWGRPVDVKDARPGDIVQFRNFNIATTISTTVRLPDGQSYTTQSWQTAARDHHTAIVERNEDGVLSLLEQNVPPLGGRVQRMTVPVVSMSLAGVPKDTPGAWAESQIQVAGTVRVYRPQRAAVE